MARKTTGRSRNRAAEKPDKTKKTSEIPGEGNGQSEGGQLKDGESGRDVSPVNRRDQRGRDEAVERATRGLIRLEGRRRRRAVLRWMVQLALAGSLIGGAIYYSSDYIPTEQVQRYWQELKSKLPIIDEESQAPDS